MPEPRFFSVAQVADRAGCRPRDVSDFFYRGTWTNRASCESPAGEPFPPTMSPRFAWS